MSGGEYMHCCVCGTKAYYDSEVDYEISNTESVWALCRDCASKPHVLLVGDTVVSPSWERECTIDPPSPELLLRIAQVLHTRYCEGDHCTKTPRPIDVGTAYSVLTAITGGK